jgi:hypothetical protein
MRTLGVMLGILIVLGISGYIAQKDQRIAELEQIQIAADKCQPVMEGDIAVVALRNGNIECAIRGRRDGQRQLLHTPS